MPEIFAQRNIEETNELQGLWNRIRNIIMNNKITVLDMEIALAKYFGWRNKLIVPNISWGMELHECDLLVLSKNGFATEIEIKINRADLIRDQEKTHGHISHKIKYLYFAVPENLLDLNSFLPERAGLIKVFRYKNNGGIYCETIRKAKPNGNYKFSDSEKYKMARLGAMRIWGLKRKMKQYYKF